MSCSRKVLGRILSSSKGRLPDLLFCSCGMSVAWIRRVVAFPFNSSFLAIVSTVVVYTVLLVTVSTLNIWLVYDTMIHALTTNRLCKKSTEKVYHSGEGADRFQAINSLRRIYTFSCSPQAHILCLLLAQQIVHHCGGHILHFHPPCWELRISLSFTCFACSHHFGSPTRPGPLFLSKSESASTWFDVEKRFILIPH